MNHINGQSIRWTRPMWTIKLCTGCISTRPILGNNEVVDINYNANELVGIVGDKTVHLSG